MHSYMISTWIQFLNKSIWLIDGTLTSTTILSQGGTGSNGSEVALHTLQISGTRDSL